MTVQMARFTADEADVADIEAALETMVAALDREAPPGARFASLKLADGATFLNVLALADGVENPMPTIAECRAFQQQLPGWVSEPPTPRSRSPSSAPTSSSSSQRSEQPLSRHEGVPCSPPTSQSPSPRSLRTPSSPPRTSCAPGFVLDNSAAVGVPESWLTPLGLLKAAGATGLLLGLLGVPLIGPAAAVGLVLFFVGAIVIHLRARNYALVFPEMYLVLAASALALALAA